MLEITPSNGECCEHTFILAHDLDATVDDLRMLPNAFLQNLGECGKESVAKVIISDYWNELDGADPDTYFYCPDHFSLFIDSQTEPE